MKQEFNHIPSDLKIAQKMEQLNLQPSAGLWDRIEAQLDKEASTILIPWYQQHISGVAGLILGMLILGFSHEKNSFENIAEISNKNNSSIVYSNNDNLPAQKKVANPQSATSISHELAANTSSTSIESNIQNNTRIEKVDNAVIRDKKISRRLNNKKTQTIQNKNGNMAIDLMNATIPDKQIKQEQYFVSRNNEMIILEVIGEKNIPLALTEKSETIGDENQPNIEFKKQKIKPAIKGFYTGVEAGVNVSKLFYSEKSTNPIFNQSVFLKLDMGINYGIVLGYDFNNKLGIQSGFKYSRFNQRFTQPFSDYTFNGTMSIFQFDIPLLLKYKIAMSVGKKSNPMVFSTLAGLQYSYLHHYYLVGDLQSNSINQAAKIETKDNQFYNQHQLSYLIGFETKYFFTKNWSVHASIYGNLASDISQFPIFVNNDFEKPIQLSSTFLMGVQYHFNRKKK